MGLGQYGNYGSQVAGLGYCGNYSNYSNYSNYGNYSNYRKYGSLPLEVYNNARVGWQLVLYSTQAHVQYYIIMLKTINLLNGYVIMNNINFDSNRVSVGITIITMVNTCSMQVAGTLMP